MIRRTINDNPCAENDELTVRAQAGTTITSNAIIARTVEDCATQHTNLSIFGALSVRIASSDGGFILSVRYRDHLLIDQC